MAEVCYFCADASQRLCGLFRNLVSNKQRNLRTMSVEKGVQSVLEVTAKKSYLLLLLDDCIDSKENWNADIRDKTLFKRRSFR